MNQKSPLVGTAYTARSRDLAFQRCVNLYLESVETGTGTAPRALLACPGLTLAAALPSGPIRAMEAIGPWLYVIGGNTAYRVDNAFNITILGAMGTFIGPAYILANVNQVAFFDAAGAWVWNGGTFSPVTLPYTGQVGVPVFQDTLCLLSQPGTYNIWQSNINDFTTWDPLNLTTEDGNAEPIIALAALHDNIAVLKQFSTCFYVNAGLNGFSYQRLDGVYPSVGCASAASVNVLNDALCWLGQTEAGGLKVYRMSGYEPVEISTYAIENSILSYPSIADANGFGYTQGGHSFYVLTFLTGNETWVYDTKESGLTKVHTWHQRANFVNGQFAFYLGSCTAQFNQNIVMGDISSGFLYYLDLNNNLDNGLPRKWLRSWMSDGGAKYAAEKVNWLDIQMATGSNAPPAANPLMIFRQSLDNGANWSAERFIPAGQTGQDALSVHITRLGTTRRTQNATRMFELSSTDDFRAELLGAEVG